MDVSVIIVNYNTCRLLLDCLASIYEHTRNAEFEVIVVDNASSDGSESYVKGQFPEVVWVNAGSILEPVGQKGSMCFCLILTRCCSTMP